MIKNALNYVVSNFGFESFTDFTTSLLHTRLLAFTIPFAGISAVLETIFGLQGLTVLAFVGLVTLELLTGLIASKKKGNKIESRKF
ncbi:MAG: hypothetical protein GTO02_01435, partial [Candidatus Dadabacteria bacterium]|nr:hypothetical protein [Candidatus Dadabacteria bacterium]